jgi:hypothetical protein
MGELTERDEDIIHASVFFRSERLGNTLMEKKKEPNIGKLP